MKLYKISTAAILFLIMGSYAVAQTPLKLSTKPTEKMKICKAGGQKFPIKNADDEAACEQLKKPNPRVHDTTYPSQPVGSPNPISTPPTGN